MTEISRAELKYFVERQREEIKTLNEVGKLLSSTTDPQEIIQLTSSYLHRTFPVALCGIFYAPQKKLHLIPFAPIAQVEIAGALRQMRDAASELLRRPITEEESLRPTDAAPSNTDTWMQPTASLRSHLFSPMTVSGQPIGLLGLFSGQAETFTKEDHHAIGIVAEQLGASLRNAFLVEELRRADELKNELLSIVSHELSTPLTAIKEGVRLILDGALGETNADQKDFLGTVDENAERLERLIQKIKTSTELMTGQTTFTLESFDLRTLVVNLEKNYRALAKSRGVSLKLVEYPKPLFWQIDTNHLTVALSQVLENAIQATPKDGLVMLKLTATPGEAAIQIVDTGSGIAKEALSTLFDRFRSIGGIHDRKMGGLGLGLYIAKSLIEGQGGHITVDSIVGQGTWMTVRLPKRRTPA